MYLYLLYGTYVDLAVLLSFLFFFVYFATAIKLIHRYR